VEKSHSKSKLWPDFSFKEKIPVFRKGIRRVKEKAYQGEVRLMDKIVDCRIKVLVVDDFATMRKIVRNILKQIGFENIIEAEDGNAALRMIKNEPVGLVVTDWNMPNLSGLGLLQEIRANPDTAKLPVLMVTAEGLKENVMEAVKAGVNNYVVKPFTAEVLQEKIEIIFRKQASA
jgi:two-component system, chemotaxis family, chemotaxis protein CheY